jgi:hypothetical protein
MPLTVPGREGVRKVPQFPASHVERPRVHEDRAILRLAPHTPEAAVLACQMRRLHPTAGLDQHLQRQPRTNSVGEMRFEAHVLNRKDTSTNA